MTIVSDVCSDDGCASLEEILGYFTVWSPPGFVADTSTGIFRCVCLKNVLQHEIVTDGAAPICQQFRYANCYMMLQKGLISPSMILVKKKKMKLGCFSVNYWQINSVTRKHAYTLPRVDDILETLSGSQLFSTLHLASIVTGKLVEVKLKDREKTAFVMSKGLYEFNVLPFGLCVMGQHFKV